MTIVSAPSLKKINRGRRLTKNASLTAVITCERAQSSSRGEGLRVVMMGYTKITKTRRSEEVIESVAGCIVSAWICTKSFWFLRPTDRLLSFRSFE